MAFGCSGGYVVGKKPISKPSRPPSQKKIVPKKRPLLLSRNKRPIFVKPLAKLFPAKDGFLLPSIVHLKDQSEMVLVKPGSHLADASSKASKNQGGELRAFYIDRNEVTVAQYKKFDAAYDEKPYTENRECPTCPAMGIDWEHARQYCLWAGKRLPSEAEWEAAARKSPHNSWPWGNEFLPDRANIGGEEDGYLLAAPVGSFPLGASPYGALDMIGNVWEWVAASAEPQPGRERDDSVTLLRIVKGGSWRNRPQAATISYRNAVDPALKNPTFGFRCGKPLPANPRSHN